MRRAEVYLYGTLAGFIEEKEPRGYRFWYDVDHRNKPDAIPLSPLMPADPDDLALTVNGKNRNLTLSDFRKSCKSMRLTPVQFTRTVRRVTNAVAANLEEAFERSFLSDGFKLRYRALVRERLCQSSI